jgi:uncharacterized damage-inducible protein DinB
MQWSEAQRMLARTPKALSALVDDLPPQWLHRDDGPGTWSAYDIVGHLLLGEAENWLPRARLLLEHGASRAFVPFDREAMLGWEREPVGGLLSRFETARAESLAQLASFGLGEADMGRLGLHPDLGEVTLGQLLATWVAHDLTHLGQIAEVLARRYREDVGPWRAYMPALDRVAEAE